MIAPMDGIKDEQRDHKDNAEYTPPLSSAAGGLSKIIVYGIGGAVLLVMMASNTISIADSEEIVGFILLATGLFEFVIALIRYHELRFLAPGTLAIIVGAILLAWPSETVRVVGLALGGLIVVRGALDMWSGVRRWNAAGSNSWIVVRGLIGLIFGAIVLIFPAPAVQFLIILTAIAAILRALITISFVVTHRGAAATIDAADTSGIVTYWMTLRDMSNEENGQLERTVFLFRGDRRSRLWRFGIFMALAATIATFGIATDSTAVVIGAMLIAPLMAPILGVSAGLINGRLRLATWSGLIALAGIFGTIALAWLLSGMIPDLQAVVTNSQVTSRTAPNLLDLAIAIAAGAAGAYGVSRVEGSDALPGVAVSIALIPPLAVIGITLHANDLPGAAGASLLFLTNMFSIILMAGLVFLLVGYGEWSELYRRKDRIRTSFAIVALGAILIAIPLALTGQTILGNASDLRKGTEAVDTWLGEDTQYRVNDLSVDGDEIDVQLIGPGIPPLPPTSTLAEIVTDEIGRPLTVRVAWIREHTNTSESG
jgi:uncharacterized hydrophobic protein (TIGR00271 family)